MGIFPIDSSQAEGPMEGVVVSAQKVGTSITLSVLSNKTGDYQFPRAKLGAGVYALRIRAIGFDADTLAPVTIAPGQATLLNIPLTKTADLAAQLTNAEWNEQPRPRGAEYQDPGNPYGSLRFA